MRVIFITKIKKKFITCQRKHLQTITIKKPELYFFVKERLFLIKLNERFFRNSNRHYGNTLTHTQEQMNNCQVLKLNKIYLLYNRWGHNFHHFLMDIMIGMDVKTIQDNHLQVVFPAVYSKRAIPVDIINTFKDIMKIFEIDNYLILEEHCDLNISCQEMHLNIQPDKDLFIHNLMSSIPIKKVNSPYIYIQRENSQLVLDPNLSFEDFNQNKHIYPRRFLINSNKIKHELKKKYNFEFISTEKMSFTQRLASVNSAQIIILEGGASLDNLHFRNKDSLVICLCPYSQNYHKGLVKHVRKWTNNIYFGSYIYDFKKSQIPKITTSLDLFASSPWLLSENSITKMFTFLEQHL